MENNLRQLWISAGGKAPEEWAFCSLEELLLTPKSISVGVMYPGKHTQGGVPLIKVGDVKDGKVVAKPDFCISDKVDQEYKRTRLNGNELLITLVGNPGDCVLATEEMVGWNVARALAVVSLKKPELRSWVRLILLSKPSKHIIDSRLNTTVQKTLNLKDIKELPIPLPPEGVRHHLSSMVEVLDDKIQLNRQTNQTLEAMAQALFKSWFVDFDPVIDNALAAGHEIPEPLQARAEQRKALLADDCSGGTSSERVQPLPESIRQLFPNRFVLDAEMGWIPEGWESTNMTEVVKSVSDTYPLKNVDQVIFLNTGDIESGRFLHNEFSKTEGLPGQAKKSIQQGDILYSEIRPKNRRYAFVNFDGSNHVVSTKLMVLRAKEGYDSLFAYFILTQDVTVNDLQHIAEVRSGTFPQITYRELSQIKAILPKDRKVVDIFTETFLKQSFDKSFELERNAEALTKLRDTLLPKLISGELRLPEMATANQQSCQETATA